MAIKLCEKYDSLTPVQRITMVGEVVHAIQTSDKIFEMAEDLIKLAMLQGAFDGVTFLPTEKETNTDNQKQ